MSDSRGVKTRIYVKSNISRYDITITSDLITTQTGLIFSGTVYIAGFVSKISK